MYVMYGIQDAMYMSETTVKFYLILKVPKVASYLPQFQIEQTEIQLKVIKWT